MPDSAQSIPRFSGDELRTILLVDAEVVVRTPLADFLRDCGLTVIEVSDAEEAKTVLLEGGVAVDVVLCDVVTIGAMEGFAFSRWLKSRLPDIPVLLAGSLDKAASIARDLCNEAPSLARPYDPSLVLEAMRRALASRQRVSSDDTAQISNCTGNAGGAEAMARHKAIADGAVYVPPSNDPEVIAGQGTIAVELLDQLPRLQAICVAMGGGGQISGIASVKKVHSPATRIVGVAAENSMALASAMSAGSVVEVPHIDTLADGCAGAIDDDSITLPLARNLVDEVVVCTEHEIRAALGLIFSEERLFVEGSAALALAGRLKTGRTDERSAVVFCGANINPAQLRQSLQNADGLHFRRSLNMQRMTGFRRLC